jgi:hypothetical protein
MKPLRLVLVAIPMLCVSPAFPDDPRAPSKTLPTATPPGGDWGGDATAWLSYPPHGLFDSAQKIDEKDTYEVVASAKDLLISALGDLSAKTFSKISADDARRYTGHYYRCPEGKTPYLVRAAYGNSFYGQFTFERAGRNIFVRHGSLGHRSQAFKTAFVLNLDFEPEQAYVAVDIAE